SVTINGVDGILPGAISFAPFSLVLRFGYDGIDVIDLNLFEHWFRSVFNRRHPYYVITSQMPGVKYAVNTANVTSNLKDGSSTEIEVSLNVYKGYSESVNWTDSEFLFDSNWMFENGIPLDFTPKYTHTSNQFTIWNGSTDTINPRFKHDLKILINLNASGGFELVNYTTGDIFKYNKSIDKNTDFVLDGVYAYRDINRVGIDTNRGIITLAPGKNEFKIKGDVSDIKTTFKFPFIYR
ncbi:TPA: phage tail family protein, partial [Staphylococcus aureus]